jgi:hypothetical protein
MKKDTMEVCELSSMKQGKTKEHQRKGGDM